MEKMERLLADSVRKTSTNEKSVNEYSQIKKELSNLLAQRDAELKHQHECTKEKENNYLKEKEHRVKLEEELLKIDQKLTEKEMEIKRLDSVVAKKSSTMIEVTKLKNTIQETQSELDTVLRREKEHLAEIEKVASREKRLFNELEEASKQHHQDVDHINTLNINLKSVQKELSEVQSINADMNRQIRMLRTENNRLAEALQVEKEQGRQDKESVKNKLTAEIKAKEAELMHIQNQVNDLCARFDHEVQNKNEIKQQNREKLYEVADQMKHLQEALEEAEKNVKLLRDVECTLRESIKQKDEEIHSLANRTRELEYSLAANASQLSKEVTDKEQFKNKKKEEINAIQDRFAVAKTAMEEEVRSLWKQIDEKTSHLKATRDELEKCKQSVVEAATEKFNLETLLADFKTNETSYQRQVGGLQVTLSQKDQEIKFLQLKQTSLGEQIQVLEDELQGYRLSHNNKDGDIYKLQNDVTDLARKLKTHVDVLLEDDGSSMAASSNRPYSASYASSIAVKSPERQNSIKKDHHASDKPAYAKPTEASLNRSTTPKLTRTASRN